MQVHLQARRLLKHAQLWPSILSLCSVLGRVLECAAHDDFLGTFAGCKAGAALIESSLDAFNTLACLLCYTLLYHDPD